MVLTYNQLRAGISFQCLFTTTFSSTLLDSLYNTECVQCCGLGFFGGVGEGVGCWGIFCLVVLFLVGFFYLFGVVFFFYSCFMFILLKSYMPHSNAVHTVMQH